jgi:hypothetical protein
MTMPPVTVAPTRMVVINVSRRTPVITGWVITRAVVIVRAIVIARTIVDRTRNSDADVNTCLRLV